MLSGKILAIAGGVMALIILIFGIYFKWSQDQFAHMNQKLAEQSVTIAAQKQGLDDLTNRVQTIQNLQNNFNTAVNKIRSETDQTKQTIGQLSNTQKAASDPRGTETAINTFTSSMFNDLTSISKGTNLQPATPPATPPATTPAKGK